jgi:hypothetical protein
MANLDVIFQHQATGYTSLSQAEPAPRDRQDMGWGDARNYFYSALTAASQVNRDDYFVKTFRAVGQVIHLLEDMAVPAHVRNDFQSHLIFQKITLDINFTNWWANPFEYYVKNNPSIIFTVDPDVPNLTDPHITDFWDTTDTSSSASPGMGLAEYTNRSFFSDQTIPGNNYNLSDPYYTVHVFPLPQLVSGTYDCRDRLPESTEPTRYVSRRPCPVPEGSGEVDHFVAYSFLNSEDEIRNMQAKKYVLDDNVHDTYAKQLLPKAIGYSAALLDYFFRGTIQLTLPDTLTESYSHIHLKAVNTTANGEEMNNAEEIKLVVRYKLRNEDPMQGKVVPETVPAGEDGYHYLVAPVTRVFEQEDNGLWLLRSH